MPETDSRLATVIAEAAVGMLGWTVKPGTGHRAVGEPESGSGAVPGRVLPCRWCGLGKGVPARPARR
jgi:hypothetical protein